MFFQTHGEQQVYKCTTCNSIFSNQYHLSKHKANQHGENLGSSEYNCSFCKERFQKVADLLRHVLNAHGQSNYGVRPSGSSCAAGSSVDSTFVGTVNRNDPLLQKNDMKRFISPCNESDHIKMTLPYVNQMENENNLKSNIHFDSHNSQESLTNSNTTSNYHNQDSTTTQTSSSKDLPNLLMNNRAMRQQPFINDNSFPDNLINNQPSNIPFKQYNNHC